MLACEMAVVLKLDTFLSVCCWFFVFFRVSDTYTGFLHQCRPHISNKDKPYTNASFVYCVDRYACTACMSACQNMFWKAKEEISVCDPQQIIGGIKTNVCSSAHLFVSLSVLFVWCESIMSSFGTTCVTLDRERNS